MTLQEIKKAVDQVLTVHWTNLNYTVVVKGNDLYIKASGGNITYLEPKSYPECFVAEEEQESEFLEFTEEVCYTPDYVHISYVKFKLTSQEIENIKKARAVLAANDFINAIQVDFNADIAMMDDEKAVVSPDDAYFTPHHGHITVNKSAVFCTVVSKYSADEIEFSPSLNLEQVF